MNEILEMLPALPVIDLGFVHPALAGADAVQLALIGFVSWTGGLFMTGGE